MTASYFPADLLGSCLAKRSGAGLFIPQFNSPIPRPWLLTSVSGVQTAIHIGQGSDQFTYSDLSKAISELPGVLFASTKIEVDPNTSFNSALKTGSLGDLIFNAGIALINVKPIGSEDPFDTERIGFEVAPASFTDSIGFTEWRIVVETGSGTRTLWSRNNNIV